MSHPNAPDEKPAATTVQPDENRALVARRTQVQDYLAKRTEQLGKWARGALEPDALIRFALLEWSKSPGLQACTPDSLYLALIACAQLGLEPSGLKQEAFIIPYPIWNPVLKTKVMIATFQPGWRGLVKLARRSRVVHRLTSHPVYANDVFEVDLGTEARVVHRPAMSDRGKLIGAYALAKLDDGEFEIELMSIDDLEKIREHATKGGRETPAYANWADQMFRKAPLRRLCKRLPLGDDYFRAARADELLEGGDVRAYKDVIDVDGVLPELAGTGEPEGQPAQLPAGESRPAEPTDRPKVTPAARATGQIRQAQSGRRSKGEVELPPKPDTPASEPDPVDAAIAQIRADLETSLANPDSLPGIHKRIWSLPAGQERADLVELLMKAEAAVKGGAS